MVLTQIVVALVALAGVLIPVYYFGFGISGKVRRAERFQQLRGEFSKEKDETNYRQMSHLIEAEVEGIRDEQNIRRFGFRRRRTIGSWLVIGSTVPMLILTILLFVIGEKTMNAWKEWQVNTLVVSAFMGIYGSFVLLAIGITFFFTGSVGSLGMKERRAQALLDAYKKSLGKWVGKEATSSILSVCDGHVVAEVTVGGDSHIAWLAPDGLAPKRKAVTPVLNNLIPSEGSPPPVCFVYSTIRLGIRSRMSQKRDPSYAFVLHDELLMFQFRKQALDMICPNRETGTVLHYEPPSS